MTGAPTALVTGASSGIGEQLARELDRRGRGTILVARRAERLEALAAELRNEAVVIPHDIAADPEGLVAAVRDRGLEVELLVNNAGIGAYGRFWEIDEGRDAAQVRLNCEAVVVLTRAFLPAMIERGTGGVIVVASTAGMQPIPYEATYAATKAFALNLTDALAIELRGTGVRAMSVNPGPVDTEWQQGAGVDEVGFVPGEIDAARVAVEALNAWESGQRSVVPGRLIRWLIRGAQLGPRGLQLRLTERIYRPRG